MAISNLRSRHPAEIDRRKMPRFFGFCPFFAEKSGIFAQKYTFPVLAISVLFPPPTASKTRIADPWGFLLNVPSSGGSNPVRHP